MDKLGALHELGIDQQPRDDAGNSGAGRQGRQVCSSLSRSVLGCDPIPYSLFSSPVCMGLPVHDAVTGILTARMIRAGLSYIHELLC